MNEQRVPGEVRGRRPCDEPCREAQHGEQRELAVVGRKDPQRPPLRVTAEREAIGAPRRPVVVHSPEQEPRQHVDGPAATGPAASKAVLPGDDSAPPDAAQPASRQTLTPQRVVELALEIIDREGLDALNMRRLATGAGVKPMSLYHHFPNKEAILDGVAEAIAAAAVGLPPAEAAWRDKVRFLFTSLHLLVQAHPRALPLISTGVIRTPSGRRWMEALMSTLLEAGFTVEQAAHLYHALGAYTLGLGYARLLALDVPAGTIVGQLAGHWADYPNLLRVGMRLTAWDRPGEFEVGLEALLTRFAEEPAPHRREVAP